MNPTNPALVVDQMESTLAKMTESYNERLFRALENAGSPDSSATRKLLEDRSRELAATYAKFASELTITQALIANLPTSDEATARHRQVVIADAQGHLTALRRHAAALIATCSSASRSG